MATSHTCALLLVMVSLAQAVPNLMLLFLDQWRWDFAGFDAPQVRTPNLAAVAAKGTRFTHAFSPAPLCAPARGALGSGKEYDESPVPDNEINYPVDGSCPTYYSQLQQAGYHVMMAGKDHLTMALGVGVNGTIHAKQLGFDDWERTSDKYEVFADGKPEDQWTESLQENGLFDSTSACYGTFGGGTCCDSISGLEAGAMCPRTSEQQPDDWTEASAESLLGRKPVGKPWFMQVGFPGPHPPFIITEAMNKSVAGRTYPPPQGSADSFGDEFYQVMRRQYAAEIENIDSLIGKLIQKLEASGELNNTVIAVAADHGEMLGDYNKFAKSQPWDGSARVPLLFMGPGVKAGVVVKQPATTLDIVGTFLDFGGAKLAANMTTQSLRSLLGGAAGGRNHVNSGLGSTSFVGERDNEVNPEGLAFPPGGGSNWRMVVKQMNDTSVLKLVCCPTGCNGINGNSTLFPKSSSAQIFLMEVSGDQMEIDLLSRGSGKSEAAELVTHLPSAYQSACGHLVDSELTEVVV